MEMLSKLEEKVLKLIDIAHNFAKENARLLDENSRLIEELEKTRLSLTKKDQELSSNREKDTQEVHNVVVSLIQDIDALIQSNEK